MSSRLIEGLVAQISPQTNWPDSFVRRKVRKAVGMRLAAAIAAAGGRAKINDYFALGVAGVVSGAMHDLEGERGVVVSSEAHPTPWVAFGDARLADSPVSVQQAELAIAVATAHIDRAFEVGRLHGQSADVSQAPKVTYFGFDSATLPANSVAVVTAAAEHLHSRPESQVTLTGHTDPSGPEDYNYELGLRRAKAVAQTLIAAGARADQIVTFSQGEQSPMTLAPGHFRLDRRVTLDYVTRPGPYRDVGRDEAMAEVQAAIPPTYADVIRFVPRPLPAPDSTSAEGSPSITQAQVQLENWRWGHIPPTLRGEINTWIRGYGPMLTARLASEPALDPTTVEGYAIEPRLLVNAIVADLLADRPLSLSRPPRGK
jgi:outer membrane protein OmpA-like peptidoglycan-associated protein